MDALIAWLDRIGSVAFVTSAGLLVIVDITAVAAVVVTHDRRLVSRWTGRVLAVNLALLSAGLGTPVLAFTARTAVSLMRPLVPTFRSANHLKEKQAAHDRP